MTLKIIDNIDFEKGNGLVPVIVQDSESKRRTYPSIHIQRITRIN